MTTIKELYEWAEKFGYGDISISDDFGKKMVFRYDDTNHKIVVSCENTEDYRLDK